MSFREDTAVTRVADDRWAAEIRPGWDIGGNANGGYLAALAARAFTEHTGRPDPITTTTHYLAPGRDGPVELAIVVHKEGRRFASGSVTMTDAEGRTIVQVLMAAGDLDEIGGATDLLVDDEPTPMPPFDELPARTNPGGPGGGPALFERLDVRLHPDDAGFAEGRKSGHARTRGWFAFADGEVIDGIGLVFATDALPPTIFNVDAPVGWVPTVELTSHVRRRPAPGPLRAGFTSRFITGGFLEEDGVIWDGEGRLVAQSRQLALVPRG